MFLALMFVVPLSSMTGSAAGGDILIVEGSALPPEAEPDQNIIFSAIAKFGDPLVGMVRVTSSTTFTWDFGDGETATGNLISHSYSSLGTYSVKVTGTYNTYTATDELTVTIRYLPVAIIDASTTSPRAYLDSVHFDASNSYDNDGSIVSYEWDFGDGNTATGITADYIFKEGTYDVKLTVTDNDDFKDTATITINSNLPEYRITNTAENSTHPKVYYYQNQLKVFWIEDGNSVMMSQSDDLGWTWSQPLVIFDNPREEPEITRIDMASDGENIALAVECAPSGDFPFLYVLYSEDRGNTWYDSYVLRGDKASIDIVGNSVYLAYRAWSHIGSPDFFLGVVIKWAEDGTTYTYELPNPLTGNALFSGVPKICVRNGNEIYLTVGDYSSKNVYFWKSTDNGNTWSSPVVIARLTEVGEDYMDLEATEQGVYFIWSDNRMHNYELWFKVYKENTDTGEWGWSEDILLTNALGDSFEPVVRVDNDGYVHIAWSDFRDCRYEIYETKLDGNGNTVKNDWGLTDSSGDSEHPDMFIDSQDKAALTEEYYRFEVWQDNKDGNYEIYFKNDVVDGYIGQTTASLIATVQTAQDYIASLPDDYFSNPNRREPLINKYGVVGNLIEKGKYRVAARKVYYDISPKLDGFLGGNPRNDWIIANTAQEYLGGVNEILVETTDPELPPNPPGGESSGGSSTGIDITDVMNTSTENTVYISWRVDWVTIQDHPTYLTEITLNGETKTFSDLESSYGAQFTGLSPETTYSFTIYAEETALAGTVKYTDTYRGTVTTKAYELRITVDPKVTKIITVGERGNNNVESEAIIEWWTNNPSDSIVRYREAGTNDEWTEVKKSEYVTDHIVAVPGLKAGTTYEYYVISSNDNYPQIPSAEGNPFTTAPAISNLGVSVEYTRAKITWHTDISGDTQVHYRLPSEDEFMVTSKYESVKDHDISIGDVNNPSERLWASTKYLYYVRTVTSEGDTMIVMESRVYSFKTDALITDIEAKDYYKPLADGGAERGEIIKWITSEPTSTNYINYWDKSTSWIQPESEWDTIDISGTSERTHIVEIITPAPDKKGHDYVFKVYSETDDNQLVNSTINTFKALPDTDGDGLQNAEEEYGWTVARDINGDGDTDDDIYYGGILYYKETLLPYGEGGEIWSSWTNPDSDNDGLNDREEKEHYTHPMVSDTDHDGLNDCEEVNVYYTNPAMSDTDLDGWKDGEEINTYKTNPINPDTDGDGVIDSLDIDPLVDLVLTLHIKSVIALEETDFQPGPKPDIYLKIRIDGETFITDTYWDTMEIYDLTFTKDVWDGDEAFSISISVLDNDDNTVDGGVADEFLDIYYGGAGYTALDVIGYDSKIGRWFGDDSIGDPDGYGHGRGNGDGGGDADILFDITQNDYDGDGMPYYYEIEHNLNPIESSDGAEDLDGDGMSNYFECKYGFDINDPSDAEEDSDGDGLLNAWECQLGGRNLRNARNVLKIDLSVGLEWKADSNYLDKLKEAFRKASNLVLDYTDGYGYISKVTIYNDDCDDWGIWHHNTNIRIGDQDATDPNDDWWPRVWALGGYWDGILWFGVYELKMPRLFEGASPDANAWWMALAHELAHYIFYSDDEYKYSNGSVIPVSEQMPTIMGLEYPTLQGSVWYSASELSTPHNYSNPTGPGYPNGWETDTMQWATYGKSSWETFFEKFHDKIDFDFTAFPTNYVPLIGPNEGIWEGDVPDMDVGSNIQFTVV